jgi:hypothetical protein
MAIRERTCASGSSAEQKGHKMGSRKKTAKPASEETAELVVEQKETQHTKGKWVAKINVVCGQGISLKKGDLIPVELIEELKHEGFAEQVL